MFVIVVKRVYEVCIVVELVLKYVLFLQSWSRSLARTHSGDDAGQAKVRTRREIKRLSLIPFPLFSKSFWSLHLQ